MESHAPTTYRLSRFSLLNLVLMTTIAALGIVVALQHRELAPLRQEVARLRTEVGELTIDDSQKLYAVSVKKAGGYRWEWRIHYPEGHDFWVHLSHRVPKKGLPSTSSSVAFLGARGGEETLVAEVLRGENGERYVYLRSSSLNRSSPLNSPYLNVDESDWLNGRTMIGSTLAGEGQQISTDADKPLILLRLESDKRGKPDGYDEGLLIWISNKR
jgi:hypothetical protein